MISSDDAIKILRDDSRYVNTNTLNQIADLIEHLQSKCDLEVNELLLEVCE